MRQALCCKLQPHLVHLFGRHHDGPGRGEFERGILFLQNGDDAAAILFAQIGEQYLEVWLPAPEHRTDDDRDNGGNGNTQPDFLLPAQAVESLPQAGHRIIRGGGSCGGLSADSHACS